MQTRGPRLNDIVSEQQVNEIANTPRGLTQLPATAKIENGNIDELVEKSHQDIQALSQGVAQIRDDGKVETGEKPRPQAV